MSSAYVLKQRWAYVHVEYITYIACSMGFIASTSNNVETILQFYSVFEGAKERSFGWYTLNPDASADLENEPQQ
jgi:hypothetical protein